MQVLRHGHLTLELERGGPKECGAPGCEAHQTSGGYCRKHARQIKIYGELRPDREYMTGRLLCLEPDCGKAVRARGLCAKHYTRRRRAKNLP